MMSTERAMYERQIDRLNEVIDRLDRMNCVLNQKIQRLKEENAATGLALQKLMEQRTCFYCVHYEHETGLCLFNGIKVAAHMNCIYHQNKEKANAEN